MAGLQRSTISFRRQGSSGLVWEGRQREQDLSAGGEDRENNQKGSVLRRTASDGGRSKATPTAYKAVKVADAEEPPSPKVAACGCCGAFRSKN
ncbi:hypothetical protein V2J09_002873 [Rumex salicifolius]